MPPALFLSILFFLGVVSVSNSSQAHIRFENNAYTGISVSLSPDVPNSQREALIKELQVSNRISYFVHLKQRKGSSQLDCNFSHVTDVCSRLTSLESVCFFSFSRLSFALMETRTFDSCYDVYLCVTHRMCLEVCLGSRPDYPVIASSYRIFNEILWYMHYASATADTPDWAGLRDGDMI